jgi:hypothetical protein
LAWTTWSTVVPSRMVIRTLAPRLPTASSGMTVTASRNRATSSSSTANALKLSKPR